MRRKEAQGYVQTKASPSAEATAEVNKNSDITSERMFLGALVKAYSVREDKYHVASQIEDETNRVQ